jgi:hypothetical protein
MLSFVGTVPCVRANEMLWQKLGFSSDSKRDGDSQSLLLSHKTNVLLYNKIIFIY